MWGGCSRRLFISKALNFSRTQYRTWLSSCLSTSTWSGFRFLFLFAAVTLTWILGIESRLRRRRSQSHSCILPQVIGRHFVWELQSWTKIFGRLAIFPIPHSMLVYDIPDTCSRVIPSQSPTLNGGGEGRFDSGYRFLAVSLKKCDNYRRPSQLIWPGL